MSSRRNTCPDAWDCGQTPETLTALLQLRMLRVPDAALNDLLPQYPASALARRFCHDRITDKIERRMTSALRELARLQVGVVTVADAHYPKRLRELGSEQPPMLFYRGDWSLIETAAVAIVGTRRSTEYGNSVAESLANDFTRYGLTVVSGLALGIDAHAHAGTLAAQGKTIAVLGCGVDVLYPQRNARLQEQIAEQGLLLSEFAPGEPALPHHFLQRNRLIAKLSGAVIVVEAGRKSGSYDTVEWALKNGIEVFAVPGPIGREASFGTNQLIQEGAAMLTSVRDVIEALPWRVEEVAATSSAADVVLPAAPPGAAPVLRVLGPVGLQIDQIARAAGCDTATALATLAELELDGLVRQLPGKRFVRVGQNRHPPDGY